MFMVLHCRAHTQTLSYKIVMELSPVHTTVVSSQLQLSGQDEGESSSHTVGYIQDANMQELA